MLGVENNTVNITHTASVWKITLFVFTLLLSSCTLSGGTVTPEPLITPTSIITGKPNVSITSPQNGDEVTIGDDILVSAIATDEGGVTRVQMFANDTLVKTVSSQTVEGDTNLPVVLDYTPRNAGDIVLEVIAYRGTVASDPATITIGVLDEADQVTVPIDTNTGPVINPNDPTCRILTNVNLNYRTGPSTDYNRLGTLAAGTQVPIVGRLGNNTWWVVQINSFTQAWVSADFTTEYGNCLNIPITQPPPTPTSTAPTPTYTPTTTATNIPQPTATLTNTPRPADLVISNFTGPTELTLSDGTVTEQYTIIVTNSGDAPTQQFISSVRILPGGAIVELPVVGNLNPGESISLAIDLTFTSTGEFTVQATADSDNEIEEISDINNIGSYVVNVSSE